MMSRPMGLSFLVGVFLVGNVYARLDSHWNSQEESLHIQVLESNLNQRRLELQREVNKKQGRPYTARLCAMLGNWIGIADPLAESIAAREEDIKSMENELEEAKQQLETAAETSTTAESEHTSDSLVADELEQRLADESIQVATENTSTKEDAKWIVFDVDDSEESLISSKDIVSKFTTDDPIFFLHGFTKEDGISAADPRKRPSADELLKHKWLKEDESPISPSKRNITATQANGHVATTTSSVSSGENQLKEALAEKHAGARARESEQMRNTSVEPQTKQRQAVVVGNPSRKEAAKWIVFNIDGTKVRKESDISHEDLNSKLTKKDPIFFVHGFTQEDPLRIGISAYDEFCHELARTSKKQVAMLDMIADQKLRIALDSKAEKFKKRAFGNFYKSIESSLSVIEDFPDATIIGYFVGASVVAEFGPSLGYPLKDTVKFGLIAPVLKSLRGTSVVALGQNCKAVVSLDDRFPTVDKDVKGCGNEMIKFHAGGHLAPLTSKSAREKIIGALLNEVFKANGRWFRVDCSDGITCKKIPL